MQAGVESRTGYVAVWCGVWGSSSVLCVSAAVLVGATVRVLAALFKFGAWRLSV